jgi:hypothetical protein
VIVDHYSIAMITPMITIVMIIIIMMIHTNGHYSKCCKIGRRIGISIWGIIGHIYR